MPPPRSAGVSTQSGYTPRLNGTAPYGPADLWSAYNLGDPRQRGGNLVALVEAYDDTSLISDVNGYRSMFGLGSCASSSQTSCTFTNGASIRKIAENGSTALPSPDNTYGMETTLDAEMISATCPSCSIVVVEANTANESDVLTAMDQAVAQGPKEVSLSLGRDFETSSDTQLDQHFEHPGIAIAVAAGDCSFGPAFPAASPGVISVGGTSLSPGGGSRGWTETVWEDPSRPCRPNDPNSPPSGTAAGCSSVMPKPSWQHDSGCPRRTMNDVAAVADVNTGVYVLYQGSGTQDGGTSVSAPIIAGITGDIGGIPYSSGAFYLYNGYGRNPALFNDVVSGSDYYPGAPRYCPAGSYLCNAGPGYDGPSGLGTPNAYFTPPPLPPQGYWMVASDGGIFPFGNAGGYGSTGAMRLNQPIVGMARAPGGQGYWLVASDGGIFPFGPTAAGYGSTGAIKLNQPVVGMAATPSGNGYWLVASDGGIFPFGPGAGGYGSTGAIHLNQPVVGMAATPSGNGYWLVASDGGIFPFGDAGGYGSTGGIRLNQPVVGMASTRDGGGYWLVAADGGIFPFGDAAGYGSTGGIRLNQPIVGMAATPSGNGYWLVASDGGIFPFGDALGLGSTGNIRLNKPMVGMAADVQTCGC